MRWQLQGLDRTQSVVRVPCHPYCKVPGAVQGTQTEFKNELLYSSFGINYADLPARFRKVRLGTPIPPTLFKHARLSPQSHHSKRVCESSGHNSNLYN